MQRYAYIGAGGILAGLSLLLVVGMALNPVRERRALLERRVANASPPPLHFDFSTDPEFETWQRMVSAQPGLWRPLVAAPKVAPPPPLLEQMLAGVEPTPNEMGFGERLRVQIRVDGRKDWYSVGQQIKGCTIREITKDYIQFSVVQGGTEYRLNLPRR
jgi:hypothetical protein